MRAARLWIVAAAIDSLRAFHRSLRLIESSRVLNRFAEILIRHVGHRRRLVGFGFHFVALINRVASSLRSSKASLYFSDCAGVNDLRNLISVACDPVNGA